MRVHAFMQTLLASSLLVGCSTMESMRAGSNEVVAMPMTTSVPAARAEFEQGMRNFDMARMEDARNNFRASLEEDPQFALGYMGAAFTSQSPEQFMRNVNMAGQHAMSASPVEQAYIASFQRQTESDAYGALAEAERAANLQPASPRLWLRVAECQEGLGQYEASRKAMKRAISANKRFAPAHAALGNSYLFTEPRDFGMAEKCMKKVVELEPNEQVAHDLLGDAYRAQGKLEAARASYSAAARLAPNDGSPLQQRGHVNSFLGNYEDARADYQRSMELSEPGVAASFGMYKALVSVHEGDAARAVRELNQLVTDIDRMDFEERRAAKITTLESLITIASHAGMHTEANRAIGQLTYLMTEQADEVNTAEFRRVTNATLAYHEGMAAAHKRDFQAARAAARRFMMLVEPIDNPRKNEPAHMILGVVSLLEGNNAAAIDHLRQADPASMYAQYHLGLAYAAAGNVSEAHAVFDRVAKYNFNAPGFALIRKDAIARAMA